MIGVSTDITERKLLEQELERRVHELAEGDRRKDEFLAMLAHELRNPLAPIRNAVHILQTPAAEPYHRFSLIHSHFRDTLRGPFIVPRPQGKANQLV